MLKMGVLGGSITFICCSLLAVHEKVYRTWNQICYQWGLLSLTNYPGRKCLTFSRNDSAYFHTSEWLSGRGVNISYCYYFSVMHCRHQQQKQPANQTNEKNNKNDNEQAKHTNRKGKCNIFLHHCLYICFIASGISRLSVYSLTFYN